MGIEKRLEVAEKRILQAVNETRGNNSCEKNIENRINNMETKLCTEIKEKQKQIKVSLNKQGNSTKDIKRLVKARYEKERREKNIILHNIRESRADSFEECIEHDSSVHKGCLSSAGKSRRGCSGEDILAGEETRECRTRRCPTTKA